MIAEHKRNIDVVLALADSLDEAFANEQWQQFAVLLQQRNELAQQAFTPDLPAELHEYAAQAFARLREQDLELTEKAKSLQQDLREVLLSLNKSRKSIEAYQPR